MSSPLRGRTSATSSQLRSRTFGTSSPLRGRTFGTSSPLRGRTSATSSPLRGRTSATSSPLRGRTFETSSPLRGRTFATSSPLRGRTFATSSPLRGRTFATSSPLRGRSNFNPIKTLASKETSSCYGYPRFFQPLLGSQRGSRALGPPDQNQSFSHEIFLRPLQLFYHRAGNRRGGGRRSRLRAKYCFRHLPSRLLPGHGYGLPHQLLEGGLVCHRPGAAGRPEQAALPPPGQDFSQLLSPAAIAR